MKYEAVFWDIDGPLYDCSKEGFRGYNPYKGLLELMSEIPKEKQGVITNGHSQLQRDKLNILGVEKFLNLELIFISDNEVYEILEDKKHEFWNVWGDHIKKKNIPFKNEYQLARNFVAKPRQYMFRKATNKAGVDLKKAVMIGDQWSDIYGAQSVNMPTIQVTGLGQDILSDPHNGYIIVPDHKVKKGDINSLRELLL